MLKFKSVFLYAVLITMSACMLTGCGGTAVKTGYGVVTSVSASKSATDEANGLAQVDSTIAVVTLDKNGKITSCKLDVAQTKINFDANGVISDDLTVLHITKRELGASYNMKARSAIGKEWFEQAQAFSEWVVGQTIDELKSMKIKKVDETHPSVPDEAELAATVTINVGEFVEAIEKAVKNAK